METLKSALSFFAKCNVWNEDHKKTTYTENTISQTNACLSASKKSGAGMTYTYTARLWCFHSLLAEGEIIRSSTPCLDVETSETLQQVVDNFNVRT